LKIIMAVQMEALLKLNSNKSGGDFMNRLSGEEKISNLKSRLTVIDFNKMDDDSVMFYEDEEIIVNGKTRIVRRLYVLNSTYADMNRPSTNSLNSGSNENKNSPDDGEDSIERYSGSNAAEFEGVGWIINEDINDCMVCGIPFGIFRWPHHCRSCGNLVCNTCSPEVAEIYELSSLGPVRVCVQCFWGQNPVYASHKRGSHHPTHT